MKSSGKHVIALVTAPDLKTARSLAKGALESRLVACANLIPKLESHYWWQGKLESSSEVLIVFKTRSTHLAALKDHILSNHPYQTPEFVSLPISHGSKKYLKWIDDSVADV